jgi:IS30 family transposase
MPNYRRVALSDRYKIDALLIANFSRAAIAKKLGFHRSTITREIDRNFADVSYMPNKAQTLACQRYKRCRKPYKIKGEATNQIVSKLVEGWSPEQIAGRFKRERYLEVSHQSIYNFLSDKKIHRVYLRQFNKRGAGRERQRRTRPVGFRSIKDRPQVINQRKRFGDWERDSMYGANRKMLLVCTERKSRFTKLEKIPVVRKTEVALQTEKLLRSTSRKILSITNDNGSEFKDASTMTIPVYYCDPHKPTQRGTIENTIGLLRQYIKRTTDLEKIDNVALQALENRINLRPRKCLGYKTPYEAFNKLKVALAI